ncbi:YibE/F family protein [Candidatus Uhrbacteria bacterium]|nr:YibE/F family protein [Candidatus Uhrbacteria bacterium]
MLRFLPLFLFCFSLIYSPTAYAQETDQPRSVEAVIASVQDKSEQGRKLFYRFTAKTVLDETFVVDTRASYPDGLYLTLGPGDRVTLRIVEMPDGTQQTFFEDKIRHPSLLLLFGLFAVLAIAVGWFHGVFSLIGLALTLIILFGFLFPSILSGKDPVLMTILSSVVILAVNMHLSHGLRVRTFFAFLGTIAGLAVAILSSWWFAHATYLSGLGTEEASLVLWDIKTITDPVGLFIAATILGAVGVLDDIAVAQSEVVEELQSVNPEFTRKELFVRAMRIGRHHIASTVNTLVLVYAGAALPTFLLFFNTAQGPLVFLNNESVAEEIVRILAGTVALILTVPFSTLLATIPKSKIIKRVDTHSHAR